MIPRGKSLDASGRALLEEDLRSPCIEEIAVLRAFTRTVSVPAAARKRLAFLSARTPKLSPEARGRENRKWRLDLNRSW